MSTANLLVVDDEKLIRWSIVQCARNHGLVGIEAADAHAAMECAGDADAVILDYRLPDRSGFDVLRDLRRLKPTMPVIMLTAHSSIDHAVTAMKLGAYDYVAKPFDREQLLARVEQALSTGVRPVRVPRITSRALLGDSAVMRDVRRALTRVAASACSAILVSGDPGTGKELAARAIHGEGRRADGPFMTAACATMAGELAGAELFGRSAAQGIGRKVGLLELSRRGTLFLDDVDALPLEVQRRLAALFDQEEIDVRVVAATTTDIDVALRDGRVDDELYVHLAVRHVHLPPLDERREDIPLLAQRFLEQIRTELDRYARFGTGVLAFLGERAWPGNVRELYDTIERTLLSCDSDELGVDLFEPAPLPDSRFQLPPRGVDLDVLERDLLSQALERTGGNQRLAGALLGINRDQVRYRMTKYEIPAHGGGRDKD